MMELLEGSLSGIHHSTETSGSVGGAGGYVSESIQSVGVMNYRVDGKPAQIKLKNVISMQDGDNVVLAGKTKNGTFHARAIYNKTSGAFDSKPRILLVTAGILLITLGIPFILFFGIGILSVLFGIWLIYDGIQNLYAAKLLHGQREALFI